MSSKISPGYPQAVGAKPESICMHFGPASYTQVTVAVPPTGGDVVQATEFGLKFLEHCVASASTNGQYNVYVIFPSLGLPPNAPTSAILLWTVAATGAQVAGAVNLSAVAVRLRALGY